MIDALFAMKTLISWGYYLQIEKNKYRYGDEYVVSAMPPGYMSISPQAHHSRAPSIEGAIITLFKYIESIRMGGKK